ncbi:MAG: amidohydrolase family protein [Afipia sp.]|nr:amidohydrolase family protein [Afipia sp.]
MNEDLLIHGARILTMDRNDSIAEALLISKGRIVAVEGASVVPGLLDTHPHLLHYGSLEEPLIKIWDCRNHSEIIEKIADRARREPAGEWLQATPVGEPHFFHRRSYKDLKEGLLPDRAALDRASSAHPIVIQAWGPVRPSCMSFNSLALKALNITRDSPGRIGNVWIEKDADGEPTGRVTGSVTNYYCYDDYGSQLWRGIPFLKNEFLVPGTQTAIGLFHQQGVTGVYENHMMDKVLIDAYRTLRKDNRLKMRVLTSQEAEAYGMPWSKPREMPDFTRRLENAASSIELDDAVFRFNGVSLMWDGYCFGGAQMMRTPYLNVYGCITHGQRHITPEKAEFVMRFCAERRLRLNILSMGTQSHDEILEMLERLALEYDIASLNWVLVHATTIEDQQVKRFKKLNFCHTTSMTFCWGEGELMRRSMGPRVLPDIIPLRRFLDAKIPVGGGSDWGPKNAWEHIQLSLTHEFGESGFRNLGPNQKITRIEALAMMTRDAARVMQWDDIGSLSPNMHADLAIIDQDPVSCPIDNIKNTGVLQTIFAGETVYDNQTLSAV